MMSTEQETTLALTASDVAEGSVVFPHTTQWQLAWLDIKEGLLAWRVWFMLAYQDLQLRYRRSILGPFWLTLSMAITVYSMGFLYSHLFHVPLGQYYPFLASGMLSWALISTVITDLTETFLTSDELIKQIKLPYTLYIHRVITRNVLIFSHNLLVMVPMFLFFPHDAKLNANIFFLLPGLGFLYLNGVMYGMILSMLGSRYRDISQIVKSLIQVIFFITPIMWTPAVLPPHDQYVVFLNPFYSFVELIRAPLLGTHPTWFNLEVTVLTTAIGLVASLFLFVRYRARIIYWL